MGAHVAAQSLSEPEEVEKDKDQAVSDEPHEQLVQAKMNADKAIRGSHKVKESPQMREEAKLKAELDADTKRKQVAELRGEVQGQDMKQLLKQDRGAIKAKESESKAPATKKSKAEASADQKEEAALRAKLNSEVKRKQAQLFEQGQHSVHMKGGAKSIARAQALDGSGKKLTEAQLEAQLRSSLNAKVSKERTHMFKSALQTYLAESSGVKALADATSPKAAAPAGGKGAAGAATKGDTANGGGSASLKAAERIMKMSLEVSKGSSVRDTTLQHKSLGGGKHAVAEAKKRGLETLEAAMLKSTMDEAKHDAPAIHKAHEAEKERKEAALRRAAEKKKATPTYHDAMMAFSKRLVTKEKGAKQKYERKPAGSLAQAGVVDKKRLEAAIKHKVEARLAKGSPALAAQRAELAKQFSGAHSMFGRAEKSELKSLQQHRETTLRQVGGGAGGGGWKL